MHELRPRMLRSPLAVLWIVVATLLVYVPACFENAWVIDDHRFIVNNAFFASASGVGDWAGIFWDPSTADPLAGDPIFRPLRTASFLLDLRLFGSSPVAFHLHSLLWHCTSLILCHRLLARLVGGAAAFWGAALWALHPMHVESVAWISSRADVGMGAFTLGALLLELRSSGRDRWLAAALVAALTAMLWKETAVVLPLLVVAVRWRLPAPGASGLRDAARRALPYLAVAAVYLVYRQTVLGGPLEHTRGFVLGGSTAGTFATMLRGFAAYVGFGVLPVAPAYDWYLPVATSLAAPSVLLCVGLHVLLVGGAVRVRSAWPNLLPAVALFYVPLLPVANWPFQLGIPTTERFLYVPLVGFALVVGALLRRVPRAWPAVGVVVLACVVISHDSTSRWKNDEVALAAAAAHGRSPSVHTVAAVRLRLAGLDAARQGEDPRPLFEEALVEAHRALDLWHEIELVAHSLSDVVLSDHTNAADLCLRLGRPGEALWHADRCVAIGDSIFPQAQLNRARALVALRRGPAALWALDRLAEITTEFRSATRLREEAAALAAAEAAAFGGSPAMYRVLRDRPDLTPFQRAICHEELGEETSAAELFANAIASGSVQGADLERARLAVRRIRDGCPAWLDHRPER